jgi:hypothetical protein
LVKKQKKEEHMPTAKQRPNPKAGSAYVREYKHKTHKLKIVKANNCIGFELNGTVYSSPSAAAKSLTGGEVNGWRFWKIV